MAILAINSENWRLAMLWLLIALFIDGVDGTFARLVKVNEVLPEINGKYIDYVVDFLNYAIVPAYFFYFSGMVSGDMNLICVIVILLVSAVYYGRSSMVTEDMYFIGFPVLWNFVIFFMFFIFEAGQVINIILIFFFAILHFSPIKFAYPSRKTRFQKLDLFFAALMFVGIGLSVYLFPAIPGYLRIIISIVATYFMVMSVIVGKLKNKH